MIFKSKSSLAKILPIINDRIRTVDGIGNFQVTYKHTENIFSITVTSKTQGYENKQTQENLHSTNVQRDTFIQSVLNNFITPQPCEVTNPKKIVIDFSSPNIAKPFHAGHLRSTIIGKFIANINTHFSNRVTRINYLGDWGTQFGLLQCGLKVKNIELSELKDNPIRSLYNVYVFANKLAATDNTVQERAKKYFSDIEQGRTNLDSWLKIREITVQELEKVYQRLGIQFDAYHWESDYNGGAIKELMDQLERNNIIQSDDSGKKIIHVNNKDVTVLKSDGSTLYLSRDIAALIDRHKRYEFDKMLYVVDNSQTDHFAALFEVMKKIDEKCANACEHIKFGRIKGMSTRTGNVVFLQEILDEAKRKMHEKQATSKNTRSSAMNELTCDILGTSAVIINDLKQRRQKDYVFDWDRALQSEGDSGIRLQYLHCRLWSLEQNAGIHLPDTCDPMSLKEEVIGDVIAELSKFDHILYRSMVENEACILVGYLFRLARYVNRMFNEVKVKNVSSDLAAQRLLVFHSSRMVVKTGLEILGLKPLLEM